IPRCSGTQRRSRHPGVDCIDLSAVRLPGDKPMTIGAKPTMQGKSCRRSLENTLAGGRLVHFDSRTLALAYHERDPAPVWTDAARGHACTGVHLSWLARVGVQNPAAGIRLLAITGPHGLGDHLAVRAGSDSILSTVQWQALRRADDQPPRV